MAESIVKFINGEANPRVISGQNRIDNYDTNTIDEKKPKVLVKKRILTNNRENNIKTAYYCNHEQYSDLGPRKDADKVFCGKIVTEDL
ncbi:MAG: hypothetical protein IJI22_05430 [Bacilli bacterium]|nr:hypothetical protein [Bacilli bacterium]